MDDVNLEQSLSEISLATDFDAVDLSSIKGKRNAKEREVIDDGDDADSLFDFASAINGKKKKKAS